MKNLKSLFVVPLLLLFFSVSAQTSNKSLAMNSEKNVGIFAFESEIIDYGTIKQHANGERSFTFTNTGNEPIIITNVKGSCGCTVATKPEQPIMPGKTGTIGVKYATNRLGSFNKSITITSNASEANKVVRIKGNVVK